MKVSSSFAPVPVNISMSDEDVKSIDNVLSNLRTLCDWLDKHEINSIVSDSTGKSSIPMNSEGCAVSLMDLLTSRIGTGDG